MIDSENLIKKYKEDLVFRLQSLIEYRVQQIKEEDWPKIYEILDDQLLDEIFQERDALSVCCNLKCTKKLTKMKHDIGQLFENMRLESAPTSILTEKIAKERQNFFYCSPKCKSESGQVFTAIRQDPESYCFKDLKLFEFLKDYDDTSNKYNQMMDEVARFKALCAQMKIDAKKYIVFES